MSRKALVPLNLIPLSAAPTTPTLRTGDIYWDTALAAVRAYTGASWSTLAHLSNANVFTATQQINIPAAGNNGLIIKAAASQTADLQQWQNSAGTVFASIDSAGSTYMSGSLRVSTTATYSSRLAVNTSATTTIGLVIRGIASQTASLQEWQNSSGTALTTINATGSLVTSQVAYFGTNTLFNSTLNIQPVVTNWSGIVVRGLASQTANLQEWQDSTGATLSFVDSIGRGKFVTGLFGTLVSSIGSNLAVAANASTTIGLVVRGAASQTANLQEWQNSAGTVLASVTKDGYITTGIVNVTSYIVDNTATKPYIDFTVSNKLIVNSRVASYVALTVDGVASQTGDLQQWRNSSGTVLAKVDSAGYFGNVGVFSIDGDWSLEDAFGGGFLGLKKTTSTVSNPGTDKARFYLVSGTNAGTLKLVVKAGTAGAETTILDNIPQT